MTKPLTSILKQPSTKMKNKTSDNAAKGQNDITSFTTQREKEYSKSNMTNNDQAPSLGKRTSVPEKEKPSPKSSKLIHSNRFEPLSEEFQEQLNSPNGKTTNPRHNESRKEKKKPSSLKEAVRQVQQDQANLHDSTHSPSRKKDSSTDRTDTQDTGSSPKKITQETFSPNQQELQNILESEDISKENVTIETSPQQHNRHHTEAAGTTPEQTEHITINPYAKRDDPQAIARRQAARLRKEEIYQEILEGEKR
jgi:hypothetical protein